MALRVLCVIVLPVISHETQIFINTLETETKFLIKLGEEQIWGTAVTLQFPLQKTYTHTHMHARTVA
jgi:hypothetical protein